MKVLHCLSQRLGRTGSGVYLQELRQHLDAEQAVLAVDPQADFPVELPFGQVGMSDLMPYESRTFASLTFEELEVYLATFRAALEDAIERFQPDVVHSHHLWLLTSLACRLHPRVVASCHGTCLRQHEKVPPLSRQVDLTGLEAALALHEPQAEEIRARFDVPVHVVGSGFCDQRFQPPARRAPGPPRVLYVGKLSRAKGVPWLLDAADDLDLVLVGGGDEEGLRARAGARALGVLGDAELVEQFQRADVFVLPSLSEGLPLVVLEALGAGCRVVVSDLPGLPDLPREWLLRVKLPLDVEELRAALREQTAHPRSLAPAPGLERYTWRGLAERIGGHYERLPKVKGTTSARSDQTMSGARAD